MKTNINQSKSGAASIFVVIFTTLLLGVITLSFVRIMLSEATQTTNYDLSQSAYNSALAGIEDAKIVLLQYHECLSAGDRTSSKCAPIVAAMEASDATENCDIIPHALTDRPNIEGEETIIQSEEGNMGVGELINQAYTCVKITENAPDYLSTLNQNNRSKLIPIRTGGAKVSRVELQWFNAANYDKISEPDNTVKLGSGNHTSNNLGYDGSYTNDFSTDAKVPPVIQFQLIQTAETFTLAQLDLNSGAATNRGTLLLRPSTNGIAGGTLITNSASNGLASSSDKSINNPIDVKCADTGRPSTYSCTALIELPAPIGGAERNDGSTFIRLSLPYGDPETSFSVTLFGEDGKELVPFVGVQAIVDATGRANDLFRRVEARIEMVDIYYPYPDFVVALSGNDDTISKNFYITRNCWTTDGPCAGGNYGPVTSD